MNQPGAEGPRPPVPGRVLERAERAKSFRPLSSDQQYLLALFSTPASRLDDVVAQIHRDPAIVAQVLRVVNSAFYGLRLRIGAVRRAVSLLGYSATRNVVLVQQALARFRRSSPRHGFDARSFWVHSVWKAHACYSLSPWSPCGWPDEQFTAGLLHDIGHLAAAQLLPDLTARALRDAAAGAPLREAEIRHLGTDHASLGSWLLERWGFPRFLVESSHLHQASPDRLLAPDVPPEARSAAAFCRLHRLPAVPGVELNLWCSLAGVSSDRFLDFRPRLDEQSRHARGSVFRLA